MMDPYEVLGIPKDAGEKQIVDAYRKLVKQFHPDKNDSEEAKDIIRSVNEAYEILTDPQKKSSYNYRSNPTVVYPTETEEERAYREYKEAYVRKKWEDAQAAKARALEIKMFWFKLMRIVSVPIFGFALLLVVDSLITPDEYMETVEKGWQERIGGSRTHRGTLTNYMQTEHFVFEVPDEVHLEFDYFGNPGKIKVEASPVFKIPERVWVPIKDYVYEFSPGYTLYNLFIPIHYLLLFASLFVVSRRKYTAINYSVCFLPAMFLAIVLLVLL